MTTDIVQLKEKGKPVYLKTHTAAIDGLESYIKKIDADKAYQKITKKEPFSHCERDLEGTCPFPAAPPYHAPVHNGSFLVIF